MVNLLEIVGKDVPNNASSNFENIRQSKVRGQCDEQVESASEIENNKGNDVSKVKRQLKLRYEEENARRDETDLEEQLHQQPNI